jgi:DNA-binding XRE family transcriptional regulator
MTMEFTPAQLSRDQAAWLLGISAKTIVTIGHDAVEIPGELC